MKFNYWSVLSLLLLTLSTSANGLETRQFKELCEPSGEANAQFKQQICNAYLGGAFDLLGTLNEREAAQGRPLFCIDGNTLLNVENIKQHVLAKAEEPAFANINAMHALLDYVHIHGGC